MKKIFLLFKLLIVCLCLKAQVVTDNTNTVEYYIQNVLLGSGVTVSNVTVNGNPGNIVEPMVGEFSDATSSVGLPTGLVLGTGDISLAAQGNTSGSSTLGGGGNSGQDPDLAAISTETLYNQCVVEFDFVPLGDTISFNYVFASEEYPEFVCSEYNDVFGFFLTGTNPSGGNYVAENIALVPDPMIPGTFTNTAVAINTINPGTAGASGTASNCSAVDPSWTAYSVFYQANNGSNYEYDGRTVSLPVLAQVVCGETYHIKMAIGDAADANYDSGVFLEAGSFSANGTLDATTANVPNNVQLCGSPFNVSFNTGPNPSPASYWDLGDGTTYTNLDTVNHTYADSGTYVVMYVADDPSPCVFPDTAYFTVDVIQTGTLDAQIDIPPYNPCQDSLTVQLDFTGSGADSLYWSMGDGTTFVNDTSITYTYTSNGDYPIIFEAYDFACGGYNTINDTIRFNPIYTSVTATTPGDQEFCGAPFNVDFTAGSTPPPNNYWDFGDGLGTSTLADLTYTYADTGSYTVMYVAIDSNTCNIADTAYFNIALTPAEELDAEFVIPPYNDCQDSLTIDLSFTGTGADSLYWNMGEGTTYINEILVSHTYTSNGDFVVTFEAYDLQCNTSEIITDTVHFNPNYTSVTAVDPGDQEFCGAPFNVSFDAGGTPPNTYWDFGDGNVLGIGTDYTPIHTYSDTGSYTVMSVAIDSTTCNIADTAYFNISLIQPEELDAEFVIPPYDPCQPALVVDLAFTGTGADSLYWDMGNGDTFIDDMNINYTYTNEGEYIVELLAFDFDCNTSETITDTIRFFPENTQVNTTVDPQVDVCGADLSVEFSSGNPAPPQNYWDFGDGSVSTEIDPTHTYTSSGTYNGFFVAIDSTTCNIADTMYFPITVNITPELDVNFEYVPPVPCEAVSYEVDLKASSTEADSIYWDMGDGMEFINDTVVSYEYAMPGTYNITVTLFKEGCPPKVFPTQATFIELGESSGIIPNVFTPNGDGMNDELVFLGVDQTQDYNLRIFNRWGKKVFESSDAKDNWDGDNSKDGTYFYELRYTDVCSSEEKLVTGTVTLIGKE